MGAKLEIFSKEKKVQDVELTKTIVIGREVGDIMIKNPAISARHLKIERAGSVFVATDLGSTNGTFINDEKITSKELKNGDRITIGKFTLKFSAPEGEQPQEEVSMSGAGDLGGRTMVINPNELKAAIANSARSSPSSASTTGGSAAPARPAAPTPTGAGAGASPTLLFLSPRGAPKALRIAKKTLVLGSAEGADVRIKDPSIGDVAAVISKRDDGSITIDYKGGVSRLKVNGSFIDNHTFSDKDRFSIGPFNFEFRR